MQAFPRLQMILVLALDPAIPENRVTVDSNGDPVVDYTLTESVLDTLHASMLASARIFFAAGAKRVHAPAGASFFIDAADGERVDELIPRENVKPGKISVTSAHLMGGCAMGRDASDSVTDSWGRSTACRGFTSPTRASFPSARRSTHTSPSWALPTALQRGSAQTPGSSSHEDPRRQGDCSRVD